LNSESDNYRTAIGDDGYGNVAIAGHDISVVIYQATKREDVNFARPPIGIGTKPDTGPNPYPSPNKTGS
jgi:hypothetical protein